MKKSIILNIVLSVINAFLVLIIILSKSDSKLLNDDTNPNQLLGIMLEKEVASGVYEKSSASTWPTEGYVFNPTLSNCENGSQISWQDGKVIVNTTTTDKCYVYFDKPKTFTLLTAQEIEDRDAQLTNMIKNGSFENDLQNWSYRNVEIVSTSETHGEKALKLKANSNEFSDDAIIDQIINQEIFSNHNYYGSIKFKSGLDYTFRDARFELYDNPTFNDISFFQKNIKTNDWTLISSIEESLSNTAGDVTVFRDFNGGNNIDTYTDELMLINLTESYGENIPTKEWLKIYCILMVALI